MKLSGTTVTLAIILLAGCSKAAPEGSQPAKMDLAIAETPTSPGGAEPIKVSVPQIAYTYSYGFRLPEGRIATVQNSHIALCDAMGATRCQVLNMQNDVRNGAAAGSSLKLSVDARLARAFSARLIKVVGSSGGIQSESSIEAEDLSKQIVDTEARLRAKRALADRLMTLLKTRNGPVADLVAAERSVADVQEEIDAAQSTLADARGRVTMSTFSLSYEPDGFVGGGFWKPLGASFGTMAGFFGQSLSLLITVLAALLPWFVVGGGVFAGWRYVRRRSRRREDEE